MVEKRAVTLKTHILNHCLLAFFLSAAGSLGAREIFVDAAAQAKAPGDGSVAAPFRTVQAAADVAMPGDTVTIAQGVYREWVKPPRGGVSDSERIVYRAAAGARPVLTGSEILRGWTKEDGGLWTAVLPDPPQGVSNPFKEFITGDWFNRCGREHQCGAVYVRGARYQNPEKDVAALRAAKPAAVRWSFEAVPGGTRFHLAGVADPNDGSVEVSARSSVFFPAKTGCGFITVRGLELRNAAPNWAPPNVAQPGLIGPNWSRGWIIEDCEICNSSCVGVCLGKNNDPLDRIINSVSQAYDECVARAATNGWAQVGHHIVRNCHIHHCGQAGVAGSLGCAFSRVERNRIHDIFHGETFSGAEMGCIKFHGAVDVLIADNVLANCDGVAAIWLDWMAQGTHVTRNIVVSSVNNIYTEVDHGPVLIDGNVFLGKGNMSMSDGIAFVGNIIAGEWILRGDSRETPYFKHHSVEIAQLHQKNGGGDLRMMGNAFLGAIPDVSKLQPPCTVADNVSLSTPPPEWTFDAATGEVAFRKTVGWPAACPAVPPVASSRLAPGVTTGQEFPSPVAQLADAWKLLESRTR
jgi:alpha-N-arabinofuranosidase